MHYRHGYIPSWPLMTPCAARNMIPVSAVEKITFWPELRRASDVEILIEAFSYARKCESYCLIS
jgi:hypothetical protein